MLGQSYTMKLNYSYLWVHNYANVLFLESENSSVIFTLHLWEHLYYCFTKVFLLQEDIEETSIFI
jgi:predicted SAM-dependent methyltransferase